MTIRLQLATTVLMVVPVMAQADEPKPARVLRTTGDLKWIAITPDSRFILTSSQVDPKGGDDHEIRLWSLTTGKLVAGPVKATGVSSAGAISPDGERAATGDYNGQWRLWELPDLKSVAQGGLGTGRIHRVAFAPDGKHFAALLADYRERLVTYRAASFTAADGKQVGDPIPWPRVLPKGQTAEQPRTTEPADWTIETGAAFGKDGRVLPPEGKAVEALEAPGDNRGGPDAFAISPDRKRAATSGSNGQVVVWDYPARKIIGEPLGERNKTARRLAFSADSRLLAMVCSEATEDGAGAITVCDVQTREIVAGPFKTGPLGVGLPFGPVIHGLALTPDGLRLAVAFRREDNIGSRTYEVQLWDVKASK